MIRAATFRGPRLRVTTITTSTDVGLKPNSMTCMVTLLKAFFANNTSRILLTVLSQNTFYFLKTIQYQYQTSHLTIMLNVGGITSRSRGGANCIDMIFLCHFLHFELIHEDMLEMTLCSAKTINQTSEN